MAQVISTLPLGVLHRTHTKLFDPPLPAAQAELMTPTSGYLMGNLTHVLVQFPTAWCVGEGGSSGFCNRAVAVR